MKVCAQCGASGTALTRTRLATYEDTVLGYAVILVNAVDRFRCSDCGHEISVVTNHEGLIAAVAIKRIQMPYKLYPAEIRHLRMAMGMKGVQFAKHVGATAESVSRWENGETIGTDKERAIRLVAASTLKSRAPLMEIDYSVIVSMKFLPMRPVNLAPLWFEMVRIKHDKQKDDQWDTVTEDKAA